MRKKKPPWKPYETSCQHCGKIGTKTFPKEKYLHPECKRARHKVIIKQSIITIRLRRSKETEEYLTKVNSHLIEKKRVCLRCNEEFVSSGNDNRVCKKCTLLMEKRMVFIVKIYKNPNIR